MGGDYQFDLREILSRDKVYLAIDRELNKLGHSEEKYAKKKKGDIGALPTVKVSSEEKKDEL